MRNIFTVNATQVVISESHPEGVLSTVQGFPKSFDSRNYNATEADPNGSEEIALMVAQAEYADQIKAFAIGTPRAMWTVTLTRADGVVIARKSSGNFPDMTPAPQPEPEAEAE